MASKTVRGVRTPVPAGFLVGQTNTAGTSAAQLVRAPNPFVTESRLTGAGPITGTITVTASGDAAGSGTGSGASPHITVPLILDTVNSGGATVQGITYNSKGLITAASNQGYLADANWSFIFDTLTGNLSGGTLPLPAVSGVQVGGAAGINVGYQSDTFAGTGFTIFERANGTPASPTGLVATNIIGGVLWRGYTSAGAYSSINNAMISVVSTETWSASAQGTAMDFTVTQTGTITATKAMRINNDGGILIPATLASEGAGTVNVSTGYFVGGSNIQTAKAATSKTTSSPGSVTATSPTYKMLGFAGTITPKFNTAILLCFTGSVTDATLADGITLVLSYGTSTAPANGAALTGTQTGAVYTFTQAVASDATGFSLTAVITGLTAGTAYWLDLAVGSSGGHAITFGSSNCSAHEV